MKAPGADFTSLLPDLARPFRVSSALIGAALVWASTGCGQDRGVPASLAEARRSSVASPAGSAFDFGSLFADPGQKFVHTYQVRNTRAQPLRLLEVINGKPCCGEVELGTTTVSPGAEVDLVVTIRVGLELGPLHHFALIKTDDPDRPVLRFDTTALVRPRARVERDGLAGEEGFILSGQSRAFVVTLHALGTAADPPASLDETEVKSVVPTTWLGPARRGRLEEGLIEERRSLSVQVAAAGSTGPRALDLVFEHQGKALITHTLRYEVVAAVTAAPSALTVHERDGVVRRPVLLTSQDRKWFNVLGVTSDLGGTTAEYPSEAMTRGTVTLTIDPSQRGTATRGDVRSRPIMPDSRRSRCPCSSCRP